ncbi:flippase-like domain-containing protein [Actinotalea sp. M2MS4P-6]|uniref:lysylphosphatidylglycerol synthase transmembrane domain-containing protein n=1 Tax=Actinotalea sp. M2MS4P-6 TaxID=2983762 RepID=UPI0021E508F5|nr:lysylphosphatidylglycerol synthase transmembrane domain-containing protein [Actinotalea sp. M2MS4P-6]MCV2396316.1 flippase-like domain-containing protein [Actinotalea sp. M2MS4P-6]
MLPAEPSGPVENGRPDPGPPLLTARSRRRLILAAILRAVLWAALAGIVWYVVRVLRNVDWPAVGHALGQLSWWQVLVLLALVAVRQLFSSTPLALFTEGLGIRRAVANDLVGVLVATVTPAPADIVARAALFRAWGIDVARGLAGLVLNSVLFYAVRLTVPVVGAVLMLWTVGDETAVGWTAVVSGLAATVIVVALVVLFRGSSSAAALGRLLGRVGQRIRPSLPGPEAMEQRLVDFHGNVAGRWERYWGWASGSLAMMVVTESLILVAALRFLGVPPSEAPLLVIVASFMSMYLLMATPFLGLGILDAAVVALIADRSTADPAALVAGMIVWRVCIQLVPLIAGLVPLVELRRVRGAVEPATG